METWRLEGYAQRQLNLPRALLNIDDLAELRIPDSGDRITEPGTIKHIEHVGAELDVSGLPKRKALEQAEILRREHWTPEIAEVSWRVPQPRDDTVRRRRRLREGGGVEVW